MIGSGGRTINAIRDQTGVSAIDMDDDGNIDIMGSSKEAVDMAAEYIDILVNDPPQGRIFRCETCGEKQKGVKRVGRPPLDYVGTGVNSVRRCAARCYIIFTSWAVAQEQACGAAAAICCPCGGCYPPATHSFPSLPPPTC